jgi:transposase-like protein
MQEAAWKRIEGESRRMTERLLNGAMEAERDQFLGVGPYERGPERRGYRNGFITRSIDSRYGSLRLRVPRVRGTGARFHTRLLAAYQRRQRHIERCAVEWVAAGMSTRQVSWEMHRAFEAVLSAGTVSRLVARLDEEIARFRQRPHPEGFRYLYLDGKHGKVSRSRRRGRGRGRARKRVLLLAWAIRHDGAEELIDFQVAPDESERSWDGFLRRLRARGVTQQNGLERIITDGDGGLEAALALNYPEMPHQACVFHKIKNLLGDLADKSVKGRIQGEAGRIFEAPTRRQAMRRLKRWRLRWHRREPIAVAHFTVEVEPLLLFYRSPWPERRRLKTSNPIERFIGELDKKFERVGVFPSVRSWERITYLVYRQLLERGYRPTRTKPLFTHTS